MIGFDILILTRRVRCEQRIGYAICVPAQNSEREDPKNLSEACEYVRPIGSSHVDSV